MTLSQSTVHQPRFPWDGLAPLSQGELAILLIVSALHGRVVASLLGSKDQVQNLIVDSLPPVPLSQGQTEKLHDRLAFEGSGILDKKPDCAYVHTSPALLGAGG